MERLTFDGSFCDIAQCRTIPCPYDNNCTQKQVWERLKAYEDTGLTPKLCAEFARADAEGRYIVMRDAEQDGVARLRELAEADRDGRLVVLPCKVGDKLYRVFDGEIFEHRVGSMKYFVIQGRWDIETYPFCPCVESSIGKTIFLTREEAAAALEDWRNA